ncbi:MAG TPA: zf-HC2 domain-containing protein [Candidatus Binataceae bacterium]|nr:zf-HC2 domain-containing protein [Candidatus Binataceae bacterium]
MARCEDIELLLGPFEDGELEPHEMQEVARHTAVCAACDGVLANYRKMAVALRGSQPIPKLEGFASGVMARIESMHLPAPMPEIKPRWYETVSGWFANTIMMGGLAAAVAVVTAMVVTPELSNWLRVRQVHAQHPEVVAAINPPTIASKPQAVPPQSDSVANNSGEPAQGSIGDNSGDQSLASADGDSGTEISQIKSDNPSVVVWTAPENKTTVVWVPDQQP